MGAACVPKLMRLIGSRGTLLVSGVSRKTTRMLELAFCPSAVSFP